MAVKNIHEYNYYGTYLHTKLQNIDIVEHLHLKLLCGSSKIGVFDLIFFNILRKLGHISRYKISKRRARKSCPLSLVGAPSMMAIDNAIEGTDLNHVNNPVQIITAF